MKTAWKGVYFGAACGIYLVWWTHTHESAGGWFWTSVAYLALCVFLVGIRAGRALEREGVQD